MILSLVSSLLISAHLGAPPQQSVRELIERFVADQETLTHSYDQPYRDGDIARRMKLYTETERELSAMPFDKLDRESQVDYLLLKAKLNALERSSQADTKRLAEAAALVPFREAILQIEADRRDIKPLDYQKTAQALTDLAAQVAATRAGIGTPDKVKALFAARVVESLTRAIGDWDRFYKGYDPQFDFWIPGAYQGLVDELGKYRDALNKAAGDDPSQPERMVGLPVGREGLLSELAANFISYTPEELIKIAEKEFAWCEKEIKEASNEMGFGDNWKAALEKVKEDHVPVGEQPKLIRGLALEAIDYVRKNDLVTVPDLAAEAFTVSMMDPQTQLLTPFFFFSPEDDGIYVSYPTPEMSLAAKSMAVRGNNIHFSRATVFHELIPGHWLQWYSTARYHVYRQLFETPFWHEGNALYWEFNLYDHHFYRNAMDRIGMLFWRMHRCARIIFSLRYQLGEWEPTKCVEFLVDKVGHEKRNAEAEVRRTVSGGYGPIYQAAYMLGGLEFWALHRELVTSHKMSERAFNDAVLHEAAMPIELLRALLEPEVKLSPDMKSTWRFYGEP